MQGTGKKKQPQHALKQCVRKIDPGHFVADSLGHAKTGPDHINPKNGDRRNQ